jgi:GNAT superfamily N-acetyltransferase
MFGNLNREWLKKYFYVEPFDEAVFTDPKKHILDNDGHIIFAAIDDKIVGTGCIFKHENYYEIAKMGVTEGYQGYGIGRKILARLIDIARKKNLKEIYIVSNTSLENAIRLYRQHGFADTEKNFHSGYARGNITLELKVA